LTFEFRRSPLPGGDGETGRCVPRRQGHRSLMGWVNSLSLRRREVIFRLLAIAILGVFVARHASRAAAARFRTAVHRHSLEVEAVKAFAHRQSCLGQVPPDAAPATATGESAGPVLLPAHCLDHQRMCPTGLDPSRSVVVVLGCGAQIAVSKEVAGNADLIRRRDRPCGCRRITSIVRSNTDTKPSERESGADAPDRGIRKSAPAWTDPQRFACWMLDAGASGDE
jgi:hypothetical protein